MSRRDTLAAIRNALVPVSMFLDGHAADVDGSAREDARAGLDEALGLLARLALQDDRNGGPEPEGGR